jgi:hypothetical protein
MHPQHLSLTVVVQLLESRDSVDEMLVSPRELLSRRQRREERFDE